MDDNRKPAFPPVCPICGWDLTPVWSERFRAYNVMCLDITAYALEEGLARKAWLKRFEELMAEARGIGALDEEPRLRVARG